MHECTQVRMELGTCARLWHEYVCVCGRGSTVFCIHLKIEGEELRKDQRAPSSTSATGQLPISFLWFPRLTQWLPPVQPWKYISFNYSKCHPVMDVQGLLRHRQYDVSLRHVSQKIGYPQNEFEGWKKSVFFKAVCRIASSMQDSSSALLPFPKRRRRWGSLGNLDLSQQPASELEFPS